MDNEDSYMIVSAPQNFEAWPETRLKTEIEKGDTAQKTEALKTLIYMTAGGQKVSKDLLMCVIRFLIPATDKHLKKLLLVFWELTPRYADSKLLPEMILVCDAFRKEPEILEPIMPSIRACLEHKTAYVRKNAVLAIFTIYKNFDYLIPDAPELLERFLDKEDDCACQRNAYMMLIHCDQVKIVINSRSEPWII